MAGFLILSVFVFADFEVSPEGGGGGGGKGGGG